MFRGIREQVETIFREDPAAKKATLPEGIQEEVTIRARRQVQTVLLLDALAKQLALSVSEEDLRRSIEELTAAYHAANGACYATARGAFNDEKELDESAVVSGW